MVQRSIFTGWRTTRTASLIIRNLASCSIASIKKSGASPLKRHSALPEIELLPVPSARPLPKRPYPLLESYTHPALFTGREIELQDVIDDLEQPRLLLCIHAASGAGKSSFIRAGILPRLRAADQLVAFNGRPDEPGVARQLLSELVALPENTNVSEADPQGFARWISRIAAAASKRPILILDQLEDAFRRDESGAPLARLGPLIAATAANPLPQGRGFPCQWILVYRQEYHGAVVEWLADVLRQARVLGGVNVANLPSDLTRHDYMHARALAPLGTARPGVDPRTYASDVFLKVIEAPLALVGEDGQARYPWRFAEGEARRLADAFADVRIRRPRAPLAPELQVVLDHLLEAAIPDASGQPAIVRVPEDPNELIRESLRKHVRDKLIKAFEGLTGALMRARRTQALLALRELADEQGQRGAGIEVETLAKNLGTEGKHILKCLERSDIRLVIQEVNELRGESYYVLPHDRLAEVVLQLFTDPNARSDFDLDERLVELRKTIGHFVELFQGGNAEGTALREELFRRIDAARDRLPWDEARKAWWAECEKQRSLRIAENRKRQRQVVSGVVVLMVALLGSAFVWYSEFLPEPHLRALGEANTPEQARKAYQSLANFPMRKQEARAALAHFLLRQSRASALRGEIDSADDSGRTVEVLVEIGDNLLLQRVSLDLPTVTLAENSAKLLEKWQKMLGATIDEFGVVTHAPPKGIVPKDPPTIETKKDVFVWDANDAGSNP